MHELENLHKAILDALPVVASRLRAWQEIAEDSSKDIKQRKAESELYAALFAELKNATQLLQSLTEFHQSRAASTDLATLQASVQKLLGNLSQL